VSAHVRDILFDYLSGKLPGEETASLEEHLAHCAACREDLRILRGAIDILPGAGTLPSEERDEQFWISFPSRVEERIRAGKRTKTSPIADAADRITSFIHFNGTPLVAGSGALALIAIALLLFRPGPRPEPPPAAETYAAARVTTERDAVKLHDYLKQSRVLLIGVSNLRTGGETPVDLSVERRESRKLVHEARDLNRHALDARSAKLVGDLEKILIELANSDERYDSPDVEIIRSGIRHNNLLFKIRMTESALDAATYERKTQ
jgi:hypothetical protein